MRDQYASSCFQVFANQIPKSNCGIFRTRLNLNPRHRRATKQSLKIKTNNWAGAELAPLNHPQTVYLLNPVCTKITTSFAMMTSPGGQNEAVDCSAADRGWGNRRLRLAQLRCSIKEKLTEPSQQSAPLDQISDWLCKVIPATEGASNVISAWP